MSNTAPAPNVEILPSAQQRAVVPVLPRASRRARPDSHVLALEEVRVYGLERAVVLGTGLLVAATLGWAMMTTVPEVAVGTGEIAPARAPAPVQHLEGGIVAEVLANEGDDIEAGQPLLRLNDAATQSELSQAKVRLEILILQSERLAAVAEGNINANQSVLAGVFAAPQRDALESRMRALADRAAVLREQAAQRRSDLATLSVQISALKEQLALYRNELKIREDLANNGLSTRLAVLEAQRLFMSAQAEHERLTGQQTSAQRSLAEAEARITEMQSSAVDEARQEEARISLEIAETTEIIRKLEDREERTVVRAPIGGVLRGLAVHRPGTVLPPGGLIAEIMPRDVPLVADVRLTPRDIGFIKVGQPVQLKVEAFDFSRFGSVEGKVEQVSAGTFLDAQRLPYYRARVSLSQQFVGRNPHHAKLAPGMTVHADITTGTKTILQYLLKPIYSAMSASFHER